MTKRGLSQVYLKITHNGKRKYLPTGIKVEPSQWNDDRQEVRRSHDTYKRLNQDLKIIRANAEEAERELSRRGATTAEDIKNILEGTNDSDFFVLADKYQQTVNNYYQRKQARVAIGKLKDFCDCEELPVSDITVAYMEDFQRYLQDEVGNKGSTIHKNLGAIRQVFDLAVKENKISENPLKKDSFTIVKKNPPQSKTKLSRDQIKLLEEADLEPDSWKWHTRNAFVVCFYFCGMRVGDLCQLKWENVRGGRLRYRMSKTDHPLDVKIAEGAEAILSSYDKSTDYIFPFLDDLTTSQRKDGREVRRKISSMNVILNREIKEICEAVGIQEDVSFHAARHSFCQYAADDKKLSIYQLMQLCGHKDISTTQNYLRSISVSAADSAMEQIFD